MNQTADGFVVVAVREIPAEPPLDQLQYGIIRKSECVILGFLVYAVVLGASLPAAQPIRHLVTMLNAGILIGYPYERLSQRARGRRFRGRLRRI